MAFLPFRCLNAKKCVFKHTRNFSIVRPLWCSENTSDVPNDQTFSPNKPGQITDRKKFEKIAANRFLYPEFLPDPKYEFRNYVREKLERADMLKRRCNIDIPEFYVGSVLSVITSDPYAPGKENRFVGICIERTNIGLRATFTLRNVVDKQGVEIRYDMYNPTVLKIEVLRLEKRLDDDLWFLRDCPQEYSTFPFDMEPEFIVEGEPVRVNTMKIKLNPRPWHTKYHLKSYKGIEPFEEHLHAFDIKVRKKLDAPWEKYDIMKQYRRVIPEEDQQQIWNEVENHKKLFLARKQQWKQRILQKAPVKIEDPERELN